jgi:hypothetical protein
VGRRVLAALGVLLLGGVAALAYHRFGPRRVPAGQPPLARLTAAGTGPLRAAFNDAADRTRVLVMLSPT